MTIYRKLKEILPYLEYAASQETAYQGEYDPNDSDQGKLHNHCGCVAYVIQRNFGGEIKVCRGHYWNRIDHIEYDLTRRNFCPRYSVSRVSPPRKTLNWRFEKFNDRVEWAYHCHKL
jgi:hypothetical protein